MLPIKTRTMEDNRYERLQQIGSGCYGDVYKGRRKEGSDEVFAVKYISTMGSKSDLNNVRNEIKIMERLKHPNIITFKESYEIQGYIVVVTELASQELFKALTKTGSFPEARVLEISCQLCSAVYYLHANRVLHRDLKPENVLLMGDGTVKLCDFGFARAMGETYFATTLKRTPVYMAPEIAREDFVRYNEKVDIWALGCIIYELLDGNPPFFSRSYTLLGRKILNDPVTFPNNMPDELKDLTGQMLNKNPRERISWPAILTHPWFKGGIHVSPDVRELDSPYTKPDIAAQQEEKYYKKVRILGTGGTLPDGDTLDGAFGGDGEDGDIIILIDAPEEETESECRETL